MKTHQPVRHCDLCHHYLTGKHTVSSAALKLITLQGKNVRRVETLEIHDRLLAECDARSDQNATDSKGRLHICCDLVAAEAVYHVVCHRKFFKSGLYVNRERPVNNKKLGYFDRLCNVLELCDELIMVDELIAMCGQQNREAYSCHHYITLTLTLRIFRVA